MCSAPTASLGRIPPPAVPPTASSAGGGCLLREGGSASTGGVCLLGAGLRRRCSGRGAPLASCPSFTHTRSPAAGSHGSPSASQPSTCLSPDGGRPPSLPAPEQGGTSVFTQAFGRKQMLDVC